MAYQDELDDGDITARWWLDRGRPERAAALLDPGDSLPTDAAEHEVLARELRARGLVCLHEDGQSWVWTPAQAAELRAEASGETAGVLPLTSPLGEARPPRRGEPGRAPTAASRSPRR